MTALSSKKNVVVIGGGTGTFPVIAGLKEMRVNTTCIIAVSDSGGSAGRIRDEFGFQPVGDLRQALAALASKEGGDWIRQLLLYRFAKGDGLQGHNLGNLILTALQDLTGSTAEALRVATTIFRIDGRVIPATDDTVQLEITYMDGSSVVGEHLLDEKPTEIKKIDHVRLIPQARINSEAAQAIATADVIIIGPGDYYASLMAALLPEGISTALQHTSAKMMYCVNLMTRLTQTDGMSAGDHVRGIEAVIGRPIDTILMNSAPIPQATLTHYANEHEFPVRDDVLTDPRVIRADLLAPELTAPAAHDTAHRSLLRHDATKVMHVLAEKVLSL